MRFANDWFSSSSSSCGYGVNHDISDQKKGNMTLVHFQKISQGVITVVKETKEFNMAAEDIDIIKYKNPPHTAEEIISTANKMADKFKNGQQDESYGISGNNCEGKSNEIATGSKFSQQVSNFANYVKSTITWLLKCFPFLACHIFSQPVLKHYNLVE
jgi:hypothetical protein